LYIENYSLHEKADFHEFPTLCTMVEPDVFSPWARVSTDCLFPRAPTMKTCAHDRAREESTRPTVVHFPCFTIIVNNGELRSV